METNIFNYQYIQIHEFYKILISNKPKLQKFPIQASLNFFLVYKHVCKTEKFWVYWKHHITAAKRNPVKTTTPWFVHRFNSQNNLCFHYFVSFLGAGIV